MKNKFVKVTLIALLFVTVVCTTKSVCYAISTSQVSGKLNSLISQYENKNSWPSSYGAQCYSFAHFVFNSVFSRSGTVGSYSKGTEYKFNSPAKDINVIGTVAPGCSLDSMSNLLRKAAPGDYVQLKRRKSGGPHSLIVVGINQSNSTIEIFDANTDGRNTVKHYYKSFSTFYNENSGMSVYRYAGHTVSSGCNCSTSYAGEYYVSTSSMPLTMRSGHGSGYSSVASIPKGQTVYVSKADGAWAHVSWNGISGFCSLQYLTRKATIKNPVGVLDSVVDKMNEIRVAGWAFDGDDSSRSIAVHVYIGGPAGSSGAEGFAIQANQYRADVNKAYGITGNHGYSATLSTTKTGNQTVYVYGINIGSGQNTLLQQKNVYISNDTQKPTISNIQVSDITTTGYTVTCTVSDNKGVTSVKFPSWLREQTGNNAKWFDGKISGNKASCRVSVLDLGNKKGVYYTHIYAYDKKGNQVSAPINPVSIDAKDITEYEPVDLGDDFTAYIMISSRNKVISASDTGDNVVSKADTKSSSQRWRFIKNSDGTYRISNKLNGKCLDVYGAKSASKTNVQVYEPNTSDAQKWYIYRAEYGQYWLRPKCSKSCVLDLDGYNQADNANIQIYTFNASSAQGFVIVDDKKLSERKSVNLGDEFYAKIESEWDSRIISVDKNSGNAISKADEKNAGMFWKFKQMSDGCYIITSQCNEKVLEVENEKNSDNQNVCTGMASSVNGQKWRLYEAGGGCYYFSPLSSENKVMTLADYASLDTTNIVIQ